MNTASTSLSGKTTHSGWMPVTETILSYDNVKDSYFMKVVRTSAEKKSVVIREKRLYTSRCEVAHKNAFRREVRILPTLKHPHIIRFIDSSESRNINGELLLKLTMEDAGCDLFAHHIAYRKVVRPPTADTVIDYGIQVAAGLIYLKTQKVLHRDIKSENIMLKDGVVRIADFGFAIRLNEGAPLPENVCGTLKYMAWETKNEQPQSFAVDVYCLGVMLHELLSWADMTDLIKHDRNSDGFEPLSIVPFASPNKILPALAGVIRRMENDSPARRIPAETVVAELSRLKHESVTDASRKH